MKRVLMLLVGVIPLIVSRSSADAVIDWNSTALTVMQRVPTSARFISADMAYVHIAIYDAVNAIDGRYTVFAVAPSNAAPWASKEAATASAAYRVLMTFYPSQQTYLDSVYAAALAGLPNDSTKTRGIAIGDTVASRFLALRANDGRTANIPYTFLPPSPGVYQLTPGAPAPPATPAAPWLAQLRPFALTSPSQFRAPGPTSLTSDTYTRDFNEVKRYGALNNSLRTPQQTEIGMFYVENPHPFNSRNIRQFAAARGLSLSDNARLFAQLYVTIADAYITGWDSKYLYNFWRPVTAIRAADTDGNPLTERDTSWLPLVTTPGHPEYVSGHGCSIGGFAFALEKFFGGTNVSVTLTSTSVPNVPLAQHAFTNVNDIVTEVINARIYTGYHFRTSDEDGVVIARSVANWVARRHFLRLNASPWVLQRGLGLPASVDPELQLSAVNESVCWGVKNSDSQYIRTTSRGESWNVSTVAGAAGLAGASIVAIDANSAWIAMYDPSLATSGGVFKTTDSGIVWTRDATAFPGSGGRPYVIHFFDPNNGVTIGNPNGGYWEIYTTTNSGSLWIRVPSSSIPPPLSSERTLGGFWTVGNTLWFSTVGASLYKTTDKGITWTVTRNVIGNSGFSPAFKDSMNGLACTFVGGNQISKTTDGGATWTPLPASSIPPTPSTFFIAYAPGTRGSYVITAHYNNAGVNPAIPGSAYSTDDGSSWTQVDNQPHGRAKFVSARVGWSGGDNDSVYRWDSNLLVTGVKQAKTIAEGFRLEQNYPNPFNPSTKIAFQTARHGFVSLKVYDVLGREVRTLVNEEMKAGSYETTFDGSGLSSGIYFYRLVVGSFTETKKLMLLR